MKHLFRSLAAFTLLNTYLPSAESGMILQTSSYGGNSYHLVANSDGSRITWDDAEAYALTLGGHLATVDDAAENEFIRTNFEAKFLEQVAVKGYNGATAVWLGFNDVANEGTFVWSSGAPVTYTNWRNDQPQGFWSDEDYAAMLIARPDAGLWHDVVSDFRFDDVTFGVVEVESTPVPEPASIALLGLAGLGGIGLRLRRKQVANDPSAAA